MEACPNKSWGERAKQLRSGRAWRFSAEAAESDKPLGLRLGLWDSGWASQSAKGRCPGAGAIRCGCLGSLSFAQLTKGPQALGGMTLRAAKRERMLATVEGAGWSRWRQRGRRGFSRRRGLRESRERRSHIATASGRRGGPHETHRGWTAGACESRALRNGGASRLAVRRLSAQRRDVQARGRALNSRDAPARKRNAGPDRMVVESGGGVCRKRWGRRRRACQCRGSVARHRCAIDGSIKNSAKRVRQRDTAHSPHVHGEVTLRSCFACLLPKTVDRISTAC